MEPLRNCDHNILRKVKYVLCDLDDTLTFQGELPGLSYCSLELLRDAGIKVIVVTGRPAGWCDLIARLWPVTAVVGENGAFYFMYDRDSRTMVRKYQRTEDAREKDREQLFQFVKELQDKYPHVVLSADQPYRTSDVAIDFCEDVPAWEAEDIERVSKELADMGATVKVSSIHINAWIGDFSKLEMAKTLLDDTLGLSHENMLSQCAYVGDSPNDEPMFEFFPNSIGVSNVRLYEDSMSHLPHWITEKPAGFGFAEFAELLLEL